MLTPALFEIQVRFLDPFFDKASMSFSGSPHYPNPPKAILAPSLISLTASSADLQNSTEKARDPNPLTLGINRDDNIY